VCKFDLILHVLVLAAFNVLTITAYHLLLYQCVAIAFRILVLFVRFIVPSAVQCYLVHWSNILSIAWPVMRVQCGFVFNIDCDSTHEITRTQQEEIQITSQVV